MVSTNQSIRSFFAPRQPVKTTASSPSRQTPSTTSNSNASAPETTSTINSNHPLSSIAQGPTSSLSPPPPSSDAMISATPAGVTTPNVNSSAGKSSKIISSDGEEEDNEDNEDSDSSLEPLSEILSLKKPSQKASPPTTTNKPAPSTPTTQRVKKASNFLKSPLTVQPKYKFDLKSLISEAEHDVSTEASSKRIKAMMAPPEERDTEVGNHLDTSKLVHGALLASVVAGKEDGGMQKVQRALMRTEATSVNKCWHFFDTQKSSKSEKQPFPSKLVPKDWKAELSKPDTRNQTFISGFAEDMVSFGKLLPDEIFLWILDEACHESESVLRTSYFNTLGESTQQIQKLVSPKLIEETFQKIGGTSTATTITAKIKPNAVPVADSIFDHDLAPLRSLIRFYQHAADSLEKESRRYLICLLLRMSADQIVYKNVDVLDLLQATIRRLCKYIRGDDWEFCCTIICKAIFDAVESASLRLQIALTIPSTSPRTHDLRRRLALCSFFDDDSYCKIHPHESTDINEFIDRLGDREFVANSETDYHELTALVALLDIAVDDGRSAKFDLTNRDVAEQFDEDVDALVGAVRKVMRSIGNPGAAFISRIEAKETLELVSQRFSDTLRTRSKPKLTHFDKPRVKSENLTKEKNGMSAFLARGKGNNLSGSGGQ